MILKDFTTIIAYMKKDLGLSIIILSMDCNR